MIAPTLLVSIKDKLATALKNVDVGTAFRQIENWARDFRTYVTTQLVPYSALTSPFPLAGGTPTPPWIFQGGFASGTATAGVLGASFPTAFPHGVVTLQVVNVAGSWQDSQIIILGCTTSTYSLGVTVNGAAFTGGTNYTWFAWGW